MRLLARKAIEAIEKQGGRVVEPDREEPGGHKAEVFDYPRLLQTPLTEIKKPILIESGYLKERFYLVANEEQAREVEQEGDVYYLPEEIRALLSNSIRMDDKTLKVYLVKVHQIKKVFPGARALSPNSVTVTGKDREGSKENPPELQGQECQS
jgi:hypothetical protein